MKKHTIERLLKDGKFNDKEAVVPEILLLILDKLECIEHEIKKLS
jgi:hypothetical protein